jgi:hypothetical protein
MRSDNIVTIYPWRSWTRVVLTDNRVRISEDLPKYVSWFPKDQEECVCLGTVTSDGIIGLQSLPQDKDSLRERLSREFATRPLSSGEAQTAAADLMRLFAMSWLFKWKHEPKNSRYTIHFPEEARDLGVLPKPKDQVVFIASGEILEIWPAQLLKERIIKIAGSIEERASSAENEGRL